MLSCSTLCPKCGHQFQCCTAPPQRRTLLALSGGGLIAPTPSTLTASFHCHSPQIQAASPSAPIAFELPSFVAQAQPPLLSAVQPPLLAADTDTELQRLSGTVRALRQSGWYYEGISYQRSHELLNFAPVGAFLVRNSSDPKFLFSLSVQTDRGPTSVRLYYSNGYFRLDAQPHLQQIMPVFPSVVHLVQHYVEQSRACRKNNPQVWVDSLGKWYSPILLDHPLRMEPPTLKHLARLAVHTSLNATGRPRLHALPPATQNLGLPTSLSAFLAEYPFSL